ncbi:MAG TPA: hypothetical protein VNO30_40175 [Kofleriaceae bacterium]|nr:hypothetical protein [Kofleriaceae bacterium]
MALGRLLGCLSVAALAVCALSACKDKDKDADPGKGAAAKTPATAADLDERCTLMSKACGEKEKHVEKIVAVCKVAAKKQAEKGCIDKAIAAYDCFAVDLCGGTDKVWAFDDLRVLADRHNKCVAERKALQECVGEAGEGSAR